MKKDQESSISFIKIKEFHGLEIIEGRNVKHDFSRHTHSCYIIGLVESGERNIVCKGERYLISSDNIFAINPEEVHSCNSLKGHNYKLLSFNQKFISDFADFQKEMYFKRLHFSNKTFSNIFLNMIRTIKSNASLLEKEFYLRNILNPLLSKNVSLNNKILKDNHSSIKKVKEYIDSHYNENISIYNLSEIGCLSPFHLNRIFSKKIGLPPHLYQNSIRIKKALNLLSRGYEIIHVANEVGFFDQSHFTRLFKNFVGLTPGEYFLSVC
jgi:AraC-like DNA-binding protein